MCFLSLNTNCLLCAYTYDYLTRNVFLQCLEAFSCSLIISFFYYYVFYLKVFLCATIYFKMHNYGSLKVEIFEMK